jgi:hypothetical protein
MNSPEFRSPHRPKLLSHQAAAYTGFSKSTLEKLRVYGGGPLYIRIGRIVVYDPNDLDDWLCSHKRSSTTE